MIHFCCPVTNEHMFEELCANLREVDSEACIHSIRGEKSLTAAYNKLAKKTVEIKDDDIFCFIHQDCRLHFDFKTIIPQYFSNLQKPGLLGFCGSDRLGYDCRWWVAGNRYGGLIFGSGPEFKINMPFKQPTDIVPGLHYRFQKVIAMDGYCLFIQAKVFYEIGGFSEEFQFHLYDSDICVKTIKAGYHNYVIDQLSRHLSAGDFNVNWNPLFEQFRIRWGKKN